MSFTASLSKSPLEEFLMAQWVKNLPAVAPVTVETQVQSLTWSSGLDNLVLLQQRHRL